MTNKVRVPRNLTTSLRSDMFLHAGYGIRTGEKRCTLRHHKSLMNIDPIELSDELVKTVWGLETTQEALEATEQRYNAAWRDKMRVTPCCPEHRCEDDGCDYCEHRTALIDLIWVARLKNIARWLRKAKKAPLALESASDAELADELLHVAFGIPTLKEAQRKRKNVYLHARRKGWKVGKECSCTGHRRMHCHVCRRTQQLALMVAVLTMCDLELPWRTVTILPEYGRCELSKQPLGDLRKVAKRVIDTLLEHAPGITGMFVLEPCVEIDLGGVMNCHWHIHGTFHGVKKSEYKCIKQAFASSEGNGRAVHSKPVTDMAGHIAYILKPEYFRRKKYVCSKGEANVDKYPVRTRREALIASALGTKRIGARVFFINMGEVESMLG